MTQNLARVQVFVCIPIDFRSLNFCTPTFASMFFSWRIFSCWYDMRISSSTLHIYWTECCLYWKIKYFAFWLSKSVKEVVFRLIWLLFLFIFYFKLNSTVEASIKKLTFYHIRCFLLSKDAFTPNLAEFGPVTTARAQKNCVIPTNLKSAVWIVKDDRFWKFKKIWTLRISKIQNDSKRH